MRTDETILSAEEVLRKSNIPWKKAAIKIPTNEALKIDLL